jgi:16S rRNA (guanine(966)-N(2))-methyltransferase RsmD
VRIIAGKFKAKKINSPKTSKTRPTLDRVKEALFSIIGSNIEGANVLDLFSGTGNLGLEAISRGAKFALLNDDKNIAVSTIISNVQLTNTQNYVKITMKDYRKCLNQIQNEGVLFDVIFLDPPYDSNLGIYSLKFISDTKDKILSKNGIIVYETDKNFVAKCNEKEKDMLNHFENLVCFDERTYSNVVLKMYKWGE